MKNTKISLLLVIFLITSLTACKKEKDDVKPKPEIGALEVGAGNSKIGYVGADLHLETIVVAAGKIKTIELEIRKKSGTGWEFRKLYEEFSGMLNTEFHKHIDIPSTAPLGAYHLQLKVTDMVGNETTTESELDLRLNADTEAPTIEVTTAPSANQQFSVGQSIAIAGTIADNVAVGGYVAMLVRSDDTQVTNSTVIIMDWKSFQDQKKVSFSASISAGAQYDKQPVPSPIQGVNAWRNGDYYILLRSWDSSGKTIDSQKFPVRINSL